jgi:hypothetical protein
MGLAHYLIRTHSTNAERMMGGTDFIPHEPSYTVDEFCKAERISRVALYDFWKQGRGPRFYYNGKRRIIPHSARLEYQQRRVAEAEGGADANAA